MNDQIPDNWKDKLEDKKVFTNFPFLSIAQKDDENEKYRGGSIIVKDGEKIHAVSKLVFIPVAPMIFSRQHSVWDAKKKATKVFCKGKNGEGRVLTPVYDATKKRYLASSDDPKECKTCEFNPRNDGVGGCKSNFTWVIFVEGLNKVVKWHSKPSQVGAFFEFKKEMDAWIDSLVPGKLWNPESTKLELSSVYCNDGEIAYYKPVFKKISWVTDAEIDLIKAVMSQEHAVNDEDIPDTVPDDIPFS